MSTKIYKERVRKRLELDIQKLDPRGFGLTEKIEDCPHCGEESGYLSYPEMKYGRCTECSREDGFEYYSKVMSLRVKEYDELKAKLVELLKSW